MAFSSLSNYLSCLTKFSLGALLLFALPLSAFAYTLSDVEDGIHKVHAVYTDHFMIEFSPLTLNSTDTDGDGVPDLVEDIAEYAEESWDVIVENEYTNLPNPLDYQDTIYLILDDRSQYLWPGAVGVTSIFPNGYTYFAVDPSVSEVILKATVAHEFFHVVQFTYQGYFVGYDQDINFAEMTATWAEEYVFPDVNDYVNYLTYYFDETDYSIFTGVIPDGSLYEYALSVWPIFLSNYFDDWTIIPQVLDAYFSSDPDIWDTYEAYHDVVDSYGYDLRDVYQVFALWNYVPSYYDDGSGYPWTTLHAYHTADEYPLTLESVDSEDWPALFGTNYLTFEIDSSMWEQDFQISFEKYEEIDLGVILLPETDYDYLIDDAFFTWIEAGQESGTVTMPIYEDDTYMTVIVTPFAEDPSSIESEDEAFEVSYQYFYSVEVGDFLEDGEAAVESSEETEADLEDPEGNKEGDEAGENNPEGITEETAFDELNVSEVAVTSQGDDWVSLSWTRVLADDTAGYYVYFGTESGVYDYVEVIEGAHITHATLSDLWVDTFYFTVTAYTEAGNESEEYSNEVTASFDVKEYSDVDASHENYYGIQFLTYLGVLEGVDGMFLPDDSVNRAELMKIMVQGVLLELPDPDVYRDCFLDVRRQWFAPHVCYAFEQGWVQGYDDGTFRPSDPVSKVEALKMILEAFEVELPEKADFSDVPLSGIYSSAWYAPYVEVAYEMGILEETSGDFGRNADRSRAEVSEEIFRLLVLGLMYEEVYDEDLLNDFLDLWGEFFL